MTTEAFLLFAGAALVLAGLFMISSIRTSRRERAEHERARARAEKARLEAEEARRRRAHWEHRLATDAIAFEIQRDAILVGGDPRGLGDGVGLPTDEPARRFARDRRDTPAPFSFGSHLDA